MSSSLIQSECHERNISNVGTELLIYQSESRSDETTHSESTNMVNPTPSYLTKGIKPNHSYFKDSLASKKPHGNESDLPDIPLPPSKIPSYFETFVTAKPMTSRDSGKKSSQASKPVPPSLDPSSLSSFGTIPLS